MASRIYIIDEEDDLDFQFYASLYRSQNSNDFTIFSNNFKDTRTKIIDKKISFVSPEIIDSECGKIKSCMSITANGILVSDILESFKLIEIYHPNSKIEFYNGRYKFIYIPKNHNLTKNVNYKGQFHNMVYHTQSRYTAGTFWLNFRKGEIIYHDSKNMVAHWQFKYLPWLMSIDKLPIPAWNKINKNIKQAIVTLSDNEEYDKRNIAQMLFARNTGYSHRLILAHVGMVTPYIIELCNDFDIELLTLPLYLQKTDVFIYKMALLYINNFLSEPLDKIIFSDWDVLFTENPENLVYIDAPLVVAPCTTTSPMNAGMWIADVKKFNQSEIFDFYNDPLKNNCWGNSIVDWGEFPDEAFFSCLFKDEMVYFPWRWNARASHMKPEIMPFIRGGIHMMQESKPFGGEWPNYHPGTEIYETFYNKMFGKKVKRVFDIQYESVEANRYRFVATIILLIIMSFI